MCVNIITKEKEIFALLGKSKTCTCPIMMSHEQVAEQGGIFFISPKKKQLTSEIKEGLVSHTDCERSNHKMKKNETRDNLTILLLIYRVVWKIEGGT